MDRESSALHRSTASIATMAAIGRRRRTRCAAPVCDGLVARLHGFSTVGFIGTDAADASFLCRCFGTRCRMCESTCAFQFSKDGFFVGEKVTDEAVSVAFMHC